MRKQWKVFYKTPISRGVSFPCFGNTEAEAIENFYARHVYFAKELYEVVRVELD